MHIFVLFITLITIFVYLCENLCALLWLNPVKFRTLEILEKLTSKPIDETKYC